MADENQGTAKATMQDHLRTFLSALQSPQAIMRIDTRQGEDDVWSGHSFGLNPELSAYIVQACNAYPTAIADTVARCLAAIDKHTVTEFDAHSRGYMMALREIREDIAAIAQEAMIEIDAALQQVTKQ